MPKRTFNLTIAAARRPTLQGQMATKNGRLVLKRLVPRAQEAHAVALLRQVAVLPRSAKLRNSQEFREVYESAGAITGF